MGVVEVMAIELGWNNEQQFQNLKLQWNNGPQKKHFLSKASIKRGEKRHLVMKTNPRP